MTIGTIKLEIKLRKYEIEPFAGGFENAIKITCCDIPKCQLSSNIQRHFSGIKNIKWSSEIQSWRFQSLDPISLNLDFLYTVEMGDRTNCNKDSTLLLGSSKIECSVLVNKRYGIRGA